MTISNSDRTAGPFLGNGITVSYPFSFKVFSRSDLLVARTDIAGNETVLTLDADYSVTLNSNQSSTPGGTVTLTSALPTSYTLAMTSNIAMAQSLDLTNNGGFYPAAINDTLDRIVVMIQQVSAKVAGGLYVGGAAAVQTVSKLATSAGASLLGFIQSGVGAVALTVQDALRERMSITQFLPAGYVTDGSVVYTTQLQAAFNEAQARGAILRGIPGTFVVDGAGLSVVGPFKFRGAGREKCIIKNNNGTVLRIQGEGVDIEGVTLWSVGGGHTVVQTGLLYQSTWSRHRIRQDSTAYSGWDNATFEYVDNRHTHFDFVHVQGSTVPFFNLTAAGGLVNDNDWVTGRVTNSGIHFFRIRSTTNNWQFANTFRKVTFEVCKGGGIDLQAAMAFDIDGCHNWDCGANAITNHFYSIQLNASNIGSVGRIRSCGRWAGSNVAGIYDVQLPTGGGGAGIAIEDCTTAGGGDPFTVDCRSNSVTVHGTTPSLMSLINASGILSVQASGTKPGLQWGTGLANIYSSVADTISIDGTLSVLTNLVAGAAAAYGSTHTVRKDSTTLWAMSMLNGSASPRGLSISFDGAAPNGTANQFLQCGDTGATRMEVRSNGGIANFSANNVNLSDGRLKTDIVAAPSYWDKVKAMQIVTYRYKDQTENELNLGVIAQQVESVAPELVDTSGFGEAPEGEAPYMAVYQTDIEFAAIKALQENMARTEKLEADLQEAMARIDALAAKVS